MMMEGKNKKIALIILLFLGLPAIFPVCFSAANQPQNKKKSAPPTAANSYGSSVFRVQGNVYPLGYYSVSLNIGRPPKLFELDIDSGSDLTWVQCDAPCNGCTKPADQLYKPNKNLVHCVDQLCAAVHSTASQRCSAPDEQCDYEVKYADHGSSLGVLVHDLFPLRFTNGSVLGPRLAFGCGYDQKFSGSISPPSTAGVLGLGNGKASILSQLHALGLTRNVVGHCLSGQGGGFLFFGDGFIPSSGIVWTPMLPGSVGRHYTSGPAELFINGKSATVKGFNVIFDSGSSYTYLSSQAYKAIINLVSTDLKGKQLKIAAEDQSLPICWKGTKAFKTLNDVKDYFKPLVLSFTKTKNAKLQLPPEAYLIISKHGNVCLGILNGAEAGLGDLNVIGDISLQDKMVIYDNEKQQIGWSPANCDRLPNVDRDYNEGLLQPHAANFGILADQCPASYTI
ncbi:Aspartic proteinase Asp1 [Quillaja saponaria]|uniref:Aspartic proteinase Asp1 n=1 Tax=Quillaja saponaria TaxID=32244 RepID=A0AAD7PL64_QUISA|nr:Aspartic proteinase Asp1 [Quillaja saponaria]